MIETPPPGPELIGHFRADSLINNKKGREMMCYAHLMCEPEQCCRIKHGTLLFLALIHYTVSASMERLQQLAVNSEEWALNAD